MIKKEQPIKIQLNSEAAVRSLIDGDPELQIEIKDKIACAVASGYEKINNHVVEQSVENITDVVSNIVLDKLTVKTKVGWDYKTHLNPELKTLWSEYINASIQTIVYDEVNSAKTELQTMIKERIDYIAGKVEAQIMEKAFSDSVEAEVIRRLNAIQEAINDEIKKETCGIATILNL